MVQFYSHGKLLLTGEYAILDGALGLALPTKFGQSLEVQKTDNKGLHWISLDERGAVWFEASFTIDANRDIHITSSKQNDPVYRNTAEGLVSLLEQTLLLNPSFEASLSGIKVTTQLTFNKAWGLGSSSTLVNNIAQWAEIDPYVLLSKTMGGSGYDIACAQAEGPILYHLDNGRPVIEQVNFSPPFIKDLYFVYLNKKRVSKKAIEQYRNVPDKSTTLITDVSSLTRQILECGDRSEFETLIMEHEQLLSKALKVPTVQESLFPEYSGAIKSLGAWGGDFVLATSTSDPKDYFKKKGLTIVIPYSDLIL
ncbi:MAG: GHMP kinase [Eudoraea sp.]|nr:GHMP kinase [Eudoraea sp.]